MKTEEVHSQNSSKLVLWVVGILIAILVLSSIIYELVKSKNWEIYTTQNSGLVQYSVNTIAIDTSDRVWFGTDNGGVSVLDGENWESYTTENSGLVSDWVNAIAIDSSDSVWFGTKNGGVSVFDGELWENYTTQNSGLVNDSVSAIAIDTSDRVWFGASRGISVLDGENWKTYTVQNSGLFNKSVRTIAIDSSDRVWVGTSRGINVLDGENWETYTAQNSGLVDNDVRTIAIDSSDRIWIGTDYGISVFEEENWETYTPQKNSRYGHNSVRTIAIDSSDKVWVGIYLYRGVIVLDGENWVTYKEDNSGILSAKVGLMTADKKGFMWIVTYGGINRVPIGERLQIAPFFTSIRNLFFSPKFSLWFNLILLVIVGIVAVVNDRRRATDEQEPKSRKIQPEQKKISKPPFGLLGAAGAVTVSLIACLFVFNNPITEGGLELIGVWLVLYGVAILGIPVSLVIGPVAGIVSGRVFKTKIGAFLSGFLAQFIIEVPLIWIFFNG